MKGSPRIGSAALLWLPLILFAGINGYQIFGPVPIGLANNGDFPRVLGPLNLWPAPQFRDARFTFHYFVNDYVIEKLPYNINVPSSEKLIAAAAKRLGGVVLPAGTFQLRLMGLIHGAILALAFFIFLNAIRSRPTWLRVLCSVLLLVIWTDLEYVQQLSTAYTDAGAIVTLALVFAIAVQSLLIRARWMWALAFTAAGGFLLATKTQHETAALFLIGFCLLAGFRARTAIDRIAWFVAPILLVSIAVWMIEKTPEDYRTEPAFTVVFYKLAVLSPDPKSVLADFHMPEQEFLKYVGHYAYEPIVPIGDREFRTRIRTLVNLRSLSLFYFHHPGLLTKVLLFDLTHSGPDIDLTETGSYGHLRQGDVRAGKRPFELQGWSRFRHGLFAVAPFHLIYFFSLVLLISIACMLNTRFGSWFPGWPIALFAALIAISSFLFASLLDAVETARHLVFFQAATDLTIFAGVFMVFLTIDERFPATAVKTGRARMWWLVPAILLVLLYRGFTGFGFKPARTTGVFDDAVAEIEYTGLWTHGSYTPAAGGTDSFSSEEGSSARLSFTGTEITWVYAKAFNRGIASVRIDGVPRGDVDLYSSEIAWQSRTTFGGLAPGKHTFELIVTGRKDTAATDQYVDIDSLVVR